MITISANISSSFVVFRDILAKIELTTSERFVLGIRAEIDEMIELQNFDIWEAVFDEIVDR